MSAAIVLNCMDSALTPGHIFRYHLPAAGTVELFYDGRLEIRTPVADDAGERSDNEDQLFAILSSDRQSLVLKSWTDVHIELPPPSRLPGDPGRIMIPASSGDVQASRFLRLCCGRPANTSKNYVYLRVDDTITFTELDLKILVTMEVPASESIHGGSVTGEDVDEPQLQSATESDAETDVAGDEVSIQDPQEPTTPDTSVLRPPTVKETPEADLIFENEFAPSSSKPLTTYGKRDRPSSRIESAGNLPDVSVTDNVEEEYADVPTLEPPINGEVGQQAGKRSVPDGNDTFDNVSEPRAKRHKTVAVKTYDDTDDEEALPEIVVAPPSKRGRLSKPSRQTPAEAKRSSNTRTQKRRSSPRVMFSPSPAPLKPTRTPSDSITSTPLSGTTPKVLLPADSFLRKSAAKFIKDRGSEIIDDVRTRRSHFVCVASGNHVKTTAKVLRSLALGKLVVTEKWIVDSKKAGQLLAPEDYIHPDLAENMSVNRRQLFRGKNLFFTAHLADKVYNKGWADIQWLAKETGASLVSKGSSGDFGKFAAKSKNEILVFGSAESKDKDSDRLKSQFNCTVFNNKLFTDAIIAGAMDLENESQL